MTKEQETINKKMHQTNQALQKRDYDSAVLLLQELTAAHPKYLPAHKLLASIWMKTVTPDFALPLLEKALEVTSSDAEVWKLLGHYHKLKEEWMAAVEAFSRSIEIDPNQSRLLEELYHLHHRLGDMRSSKEILLKQLKLDPGNSILLWREADLLSKFGNKAEAWEKYDVLVKGDTPNISEKQWNTWFLLKKKYGDARKEHQWLYESLLLYPKNNALRWTYGRSCFEANNFDEALEHFEAVQKSEPENIAFNRSLGMAYKILGEFDKASFCFTKVLEKDPLNMEILQSLSSMHTYRYGDAFFKKICFAQANMADMAAEKRVLMHYALGKVYDDVGELATAFEHYKVGGMLRSQERHFKELAVTRSYVHDKLRALPKNYFKPSHPTGCTSSKPVFILGMPRSGTTLMEQVLSGLGNVYGAGELSHISEVLEGVKIDGESFFPGKNAQGKEGPSYKEMGERYLDKIEALAPKESRRIVDKMPHNFMHTGFIHLMLPNASIVHARRHPVETCLSAYRIHFAEGHYWADDLRTMGRYYRLYTELMAYWKSVLPQGTILDVRYEDMVGDLEGESKKIAGHIGVEWRKECLDFHKSKKAVRTASLSQVRQPLYQSSMNRWRKYEPYLKPLLDEIGDLVKAYENELKD
ncbi:tetratricopeptide repeat-containing sulfotransferase family protein [Sulfurovum sp. NBC37-1]|uniref:tetratricopeptide repeat-containing sulfotransferase family protein n=1 Tax=Sulfurovum sp. (strain NBC37-1) TaxID=387093 RepID=UPI000158770C|nr:tetratricopeptide repeat-containing sulfotransferase family protein [Sulfurovum sp. NBC37-1]BAF71296.1 conserved hypothetical protein [Sulfurovum sp. NBC37-1]